VTVKYRIYLVMSKKSGRAYIGKGPDGRIEGKHNKEFHRLMKESDMVQWESEPFSSQHDALIAEASAIGIAKRLGKKVKLVNIQISYRRRFAPRYPFPFVEGEVKKSNLPSAIIVTLSPDQLEEDRAITNSAWTPEELAQRARMEWQFSWDRVESWKTGNGPPDYLVAVAKGSGRILAVFRIDNTKWVENKKGLYDAIPVEDNDANANGMQGKEYTGKRQGRAVLYGKKVA
jgi:hypothetical protein